jgi:hypothetical protein
MALMKPKKRQKLCYNCEGEVDLDVIVCPFCAADLREEKPELERSSFSSSVATVKQLNAEHSLYPSHGKDDLSLRSPAPSSPIEQEALQEEAAVPFEEKPKAAKSIFSALILFTLGVQLFLLGVLLVIFSDRGMMILKWDASLWFLYIFASIPLLLFGYRFLNKL